MPSSDDGPADLLKGALAGVAATWVMAQVTTYLYEHESRQARRRENRVRGGRTAFDRAAERGADLVGIRLDAGHRQAVGAALHWTLGAGAGAAYAAMRGRVPYAGAGSGLLYGALFFLTVDEIGNTALGITADPREFPWQAHARGLLGHLAFGLATDAALDLLERTAR